MARSRNIKPSFFTNELLGTVDPFVNLTFIGLWCLADKTGRLEDRPLRIKAEIFPYREGLDVNGYLTVLERLRFLDRYEVDGVAYIHVLNFEKHQSPHHTEKGKGYPHKPLNQIKNFDLTVKQPLHDGESQVPTRSDSLIPDSLIPECGFTDSQPQAATPTAKKNVLDYSCWPEMPNEQTLADWKSMRKRIKADVSQTVVNSFGKEFHKARSFGYSVDQCLTEAITRNWRGFKTEWLQNSQGAGNAGFNRQQQKPDIDFNNTDWIDRVFEDPYGQPAEQDIHVIEGDFSGVVIGDQGPGDVQPDSSRVAQGIIGKRDY